MLYCLCLLMNSWIRGTKDNKCPIKFLESNLKDKSCVWIFKSNIFLRIDSWWTKNLPSNNEGELLCKGKTKQNFGRNNWQEWKKNYTKLIKQSTQLCGNQSIGHTTSIFLIFLKKTSETVSTKCSFKNALCRAPFFLALQSVLRPF